MSSKLTSPITSTQGSNSLGRITSRQSQPRARESLTVGQSIFVTDVIDSWLEVLQMYRLMGCTIIVEQALKVPGAQSDLAAAFMLTGQTTRRTTIDRLNELLDIDLDHDDPETVPALLLSR